MMDADWTVFAPAGAGFTSKFASTPTLTTQTTATSIGNAKISVWTDEEGGNLSYYVQVTSYPTGSMATADLSKAYDNAVNAMAGGSSDLTVAGLEQLAPVVRAPARWRPAAPGRGRLVRASPGPRRSPRRPVGR